MTVVLTIAFLLVMVNAVYSTVKYYKALRGLGKRKLEEGQYKEEKQKLIMKNLFEIFVGIIVFVVLFFITAWFYQQ